MTVTGDQRRERLQRARLYLVIEASPAGCALEDVLGSALAGGVDAVQLRDKHASDDQIVRAAAAFRSLCDRHGALFIVNDRAELALACDADGVHVGQDDAPVAEVRRMIGDDLLIGLSTHSPDQIARANESSADYIGVGPVYETATKPGLEAVGEALVRYASANAARPFFAIGGIDEANAARVVAAGARRIAVVRAIRDSGDPRAAAAGLRASLGEAASGDGTGRQRTRSEAKDAAVRERLEPLGEGERPRAVTVAATVAAAVALVNVVAYALGFELGGARPAPVSVAAPALLMGLAAWGLWRVRYWAVLTMQVLLCLVIVIFSLAAFNAADAGSLLTAAAVVVAAGALFWSLVKAMARIQMPAGR